MKVDGACHGGAIRDDATVDERRVHVCNLHRLPAPVGLGVSRQHLSRARIPFKADD